MRHDKILRALSLPLIALLGVCTVAVALTPFTRFGGANIQATATSAANTISSGSEVLTGPAGQSPEFVEPAISSLEISASPETPFAAIPPLSVEGELTPAPDDEPTDEANTGAAIAPADATDATTSVDDSTLSSATDEEINEAMWTTATHLSDAISAVTRYITFWQDITTNPTGLTPTSTSPDTDLDLPQVTIPAVIETSDAAGSSPSDTTAADHLDATEATAQQIELRNKAESGYAVSFLLNGQVVVLQPGESHLVDVLPATVTFDLGGGRGSVTKRLMGGTHGFTLTESGWDLQPLSP